MVSIKYIFVCLFFSSQSIVISQIKNASYLSLPDNTRIIIPARWYLADESLVKEMKQQTTGTTSSLIHLLFPSNLISQQKGYPFISIGFAYIGYKEMNSFTFRRFVDEQKRLLSGALETQLNEIVPQQFDELYTSELYVDEKQQMVIYSHESGVPNYGQVTGYHAIIKSKTGLIRISLSSLKSDLEKYLPAFKIITKSFTFK